MGISTYLLPASYPIGDLPLGYVAKSLRDREEIIEPSDQRAMPPVEEKTCSIFSYLSAQSNEAVVRTTASVAVAIFSLIDASYNAAAALLKVPFVSAKVTVARWLGVEAQFPETVSETELQAHLKKAVQAVTMVFVSLATGAFSPEVVVNIAQRIGYFSSPELSDDLLLNAI